MTEPLLSLSPELSGKIRIGAASVNGVKVDPQNPQLREEFERVAETLRQQGARSGEIPGVETSRSLYKSLGIDPTKHRPSNEALLRRVLKGGTFPPINTLVDALNLSSLKQQLSYGLYDLDRLSPPIRARFGTEGESYEGIRKGQVNIAGRPVLVDREGPFGNPTSDSARTQITLQTQNALVVLYAPVTVREESARSSLKETAESLARFCGGNCGELLLCS